MFRAEQQMAEQMLRQAANTGRRLRTKLRAFEADQRPVADRALELSAGGIDVASARTPDKGRQSSLDHDLLEGADAVIRRRAEINAGARIQRDEVDLGAEAAQQFGKLTGVLHIVIHAVEKDVFK